MRVIAGRVILTGVRRPNEVRAADAGPGGRRQALRPWWRRCEASSSPRGPVRASACLCWK